jgi:hypothetical protein
MRILDKKTVEELDCSVCEHIGKKREIKRYRTGTKRYVFVKTCKFEKCPYEKNTLKT